MAAASSPIVVTRATPSQLIAEVLCPFRSLLARHRISKDLTDQPKALDQFIRPVPVATEGAKPDRAQHRPVYLQGDRQVRFQPLADAELPLADGLRRQFIGQTAEAEHPSLADLLRVPGEQVVQVGVRDWRNARRLVGMRDR
jgi:hypothetical protein